MVLLLYSPHSNWSVHLSSLLLLCHHDHSFGFGFVLVFWDCWEWISGSWVHSKGLLLVFLVDVESEKKLGKVCALAEDKCSHGDKALLLYICTLGLDAIHHVVAGVNISMLLFCTHSRKATSLSFLLLFTLAGVAA